MITYVLSILSRTRKTRINYYIYPKILAPNSTPRWLVHDKIIEINYYVLNVCADKKSWSEKW